jgi:hypothetical protein
MPRALRLGEDGIGLATTHHPDDCTLFGRTGEIRVC